MVFDHLDLFRILDFEFRTFNSVYTWRTLRLCASHLFPEYTNNNFMPPLSSRPFPRYHRRASHCNSGDPAGDRLFRPWSCLGMGGCEPAITDPEQPPGNGRHPP